MNITRREFLQQLAVFAGATAAAGLAGCVPITPTPAAPPAAVQPTSAPAASSAKSLTKVSFRLNWKKTGPHLAYYLGLERGFYRDEGIDLQINEGTGTGPAAQLIGNKSDFFGLLDASAVIPLIVAGLPIKCVGMVSPVSLNAVIARKDSGVKTLKDLEGKSIAVTPGDALTQMWPAVVAVNSLDASKIKLVNVDASAKLPAVLEKRTDALLGSASDQNFTLQAQGVETVDLVFAKYGVNLLNLGIWVHPDNLNQVDLIKAFLRATYKSYQAIEKEAAAALDIALKGSPDMDRTATKQQWDSYATQLKSVNCPNAPYLYNCPADWTQTMDIMVKYRDLKTDKKAEDFYTNDFIPAKA